MDYERHFVAHTHNDGDVWMRIFMWLSVIAFIGALLWVLLSTFTHTSRGIEYTGPKSPPSCGTANQAWCDTQYNNQ